MVVALLVVAVVSGMFLMRRSASAKELPRVLGANDLEAIVGGQYPLEDFCVYTGWPCRVWAPCLEIHGKCAEGVEGSVCTPEMWEGDNNQWCSGLHGEGKQCTPLESAYCVLSKWRCFERQNGCLCIFTAGAGLPVGGRLNAEGDPC